MGAEKTVKNKHLTAEDRQEIQDCLDRGMTFKGIGKRIGKDQTTISKEVKRHLTFRESGVKRTKEDGTPIENAVCPLLIKAPFVCNPCAKRHGRCSFNKQLYLAKPSQEAYRNLLTEARSGIPLNRESFYEMDRTITQGIKQGQHLYHVMQTHNLGISKSTVYRHLHQGYLSISKMDMPRVVKFKPRKKHCTETIPRALKVGRTHDDFLNYITENHITNWVEMDTVMGRVGGKTILTLHFTFSNFMVGFLLDRKSSADVTRAILDLKQSLKQNSLHFGDVFPLLLTDNGGEFANVHSFETAVNGQRETRLFFCDPYQSSQKPRVEKNHTLFRDIVPKGYSFDHFSQSTVNLIFSHVNSVKRKGLNGRTPFELFTFMHSEQLAMLLGIQRIPADLVNQSPTLLDK